MSESFQSDPERQRLRQRGRPDHIHDVGTPTNETLVGQLEVQADRLLESTLELTEAEICEILGSSRLKHVFRERAYQLALQAAEVCMAEGRQEPPHLRTALGQL